MIYNISGDVSGSSKVSSQMTEEFLITISPDSGFVGDTISIFTVSQFDLVKSNNIIYFGSVVASQFSLVTANQIDVIIPVGATSGDIRIKTPSRNSNLAFFIVIYQDISFEIKTKKEGNFSPGLVRTPVYNRDLSISNFSEVTDENSMIQNIYNIILTRPGERLFNPSFGCDIHNRIFDLMINRDTVETEVLKIIQESISAFEPRVSVINELSVVDIVEDQNYVNVDLRVSLPSGRERDIKLTIGTKKKE